MTLDLSQRLDDIDSNLIHVYKVLDAIQQEKASKNKYRELRLSGHKDTVFKNLILIAAIIACIILACINTPESIGAFILGGFVTCFFPAMLIWQAASKVLKAK